MIYYQNVENGRFHRIKNSRVLFHTASGWHISEHLKPCDLAHYPFIGVNMSAPKVTK